MKIWHVNMNDENRRLIIIHHSSLYWATVEYEPHITKKRTVKTNNIHGQMYTIPKKHIQI